ncbi:MAG TPA: YraN family protein [Bacteroidetes bacterium]|nr:YraN family protein [Bacteroidota bacterium]
MNLLNKRTKGKIGEDLVIKYLINRNYLLVDRNWQRREGEIDLVVYDKMAYQLVFMEVKSRNSNKFGSIEESIDQNKKDKLKDIINRYIEESNYSGEYRLDFIGLVNSAKIVHYKNVEI